VNNRLEGNALSTIEAMVELAASDAPIQPLLTRDELRHRGFSLNP